MDSSPLYRLIQALEEDNLLQWALEVNERKERMKLRSEIATLRVESDELSRIRYPDRSGGQGVTF